VGAKSDVDKYRDEVVAKWYGVTELLFEAEKRIKGRKVAGKQTNEGIFDYFPEILLTLPFLGVLSQNKEASWFLEELNNQKEYYADLRKEFKRENKRKVAK